MPEPLSLVTAIAGLTGFAVATIPKLDQFRRDFKGTDEKRAWYESQLDTVDTKISGWQNLWCDGPTFSPDHYKYFWGPRGYESVLNKLWLIEIELAAIGLLLYPSPYQVWERDMDQEWHTWRNMLLINASRYRKEFNSHSNFIGRFTFALFRGAELEERVKRLQEKVTDLEMFSNKRFANVQLELPKDESMEISMLERLITQRDWLDKQYKIFTHLHELSSESAPECWSLVLTCPDNKIETWPADGESGIAVNFDIQRKKECSRLGDLGVVRFCSSKIERVSEWYTRTTVHYQPTNKTVRQDYLIHGFGKQEIRDDSLRANLAEAAVGIANWTMILWGTPWTDNLCICGLRFIARLTDRQQLWIPTFTPSREGCLKIWRQQTAMPRGRKALLLGISLAELAIGKPVSFDARTPGHTQFMFEHRWQSEAELLDKVTSKSSLIYRKAVWYCFKYDRDLANGRDFRPHHISIFEDRVLKKWTNFLPHCSPRFS